MQGVRTLRIDLDVPIFWRRNWCEKESEMLDWIETSSLPARELILGVLWDESENIVGRRETFGALQERGLGETSERSWSVEKWDRKEEYDLWERDWGYLIDLSMSA
jgi:hypothetical protein